MTRAYKNKTKTRKSNKKPLNFHKTIKHLKTINGPRFSATRHFPRFPRRSWRDDDLIMIDDDQGWKASRPRWGCRPRVTAPHNFGIKARRTSGGSRGDPTGISALPILSSGSGSKIYFVCSKRKLLMNYEQIEAVELRKMWFLDVEGFFCMKILCFIVFIM